MWGSKLKSWFLSQMLKSTIDCCDLQRIKQKSCIQLIFMIMGLSIIPICPSVTVCIHKLDDLYSSVNVEPKLGNCIQHCCYFVQSDSWHQCDSLVKKPLSLLLIAISISQILSTLPCLTWQICNIILFDCRYFRYSGLLE